MITTKPTTNPEQYHALSYERYDGDEFSVKDVWESKASILGSFFNMGAVSVTVTKSNEVTETWFLVDP
jgi:hypothetical protein